MGDASLARQGTIPLVGTLELRRQQFKLPPLSPDSELLRSYWGSGGDGKGGPGVGGSWDQEELHVES